MKKLLLASTALVLSAGIASANDNIKLSGEARMGIVYNNNITAGAPAGAFGVGAANTAKLQFTSRIRVTFAMTGQTDSGLAFGATVRGDQFGGANAGDTAMAAGSVFISGDFGKLTFGDVAGAARQAVGDLYGVGLTGLGDRNEMGYLDRTVSTGLATGINRRTSALYEYKIDAFTIYASVGQQSRRDNSAIAVVNNVANNVAATSTTKDSLYAIGAKYSADGLTVSLGYEVSKASFTNSAAPATNANLGANHLVLGAEYAFGDYKVKAVVGRMGGDLGTVIGALQNRSKTQMGVAGEAKFDALTVTAFVKRGFTSSTDYGIGASYDLGGGASLRGGISRQGAVKAAAPKPGVVVPAGVAAGAAAFLPAAFGNASTATTRADFGLNFRF